MKTAIITKCGYRCDLCLAYRENVAKKDERQKLSDGWFRIYGFRIPPDKIICDGCVSCENPRLVDKNCPVRPCVIAKGFSTCAECGETTCEKLSSRIVSRKQLEQKLGHEFSHGDYSDFIRPYESKPRLVRLRRQYLAENRAD